jgi:hypothetical protein
VRAHDKTASAPLSMSRERTTLVGPEPGLPRARSRGGQLGRAAAAGSRKSAGRERQRGPRRQRRRAIDPPSLPTCLYLSVSGAAHSTGTSGARGLSDTPWTRTSGAARREWIPVTGPGRWRRRAKRAVGPGGWGVGRGKEGWARSLRRTGGSGGGGGGGAGVTRSHSERLAGQSSEAPHTPDPARAPSSSVAALPCHSQSVRARSLRSLRLAGMVGRGRERLEVGTGGQLQNGGRSRIAPPSLPSGPSSAGRAGALRRSQAQCDSDNAGRVSQVRVTLVRPGPGPTRTPPPSRRDGGPPLGIDSVQVPGSPVDSDSQPGRQQLEADSDRAPYRPLDWKCGPSRIIHWQVTTRTSPTRMASRVPVGVTG